MIRLKSCFLSKNTARLVLQVSQGIEFESGVYSLIGDVISLDYLVRVFFYSIMYVDNYFMSLP